MFFDTNKILTSVEDAKQKTTEFIDDASRYSIRKSVSAKWQLKSKKPDKVLREVKFNFDKEIPLFKVIGLFVGGLFLFCILSKFALFLYKIKCRREWTLEQRQKMKKANKKELNS